MPVKFSNPRKLAEIADYPLGGDKRGKCVFEVEDGGKKGQRCKRTTTGKPKVDTYATAVVIVDGDNGQTYVLKYSDNYGTKSVTVARHDFKNAASEDTGKAQGSTFYPDDERYAELLALVFPA